MAEKKLTVITEGKPFPGGNSRQTVRTRKMIQPRCDICGPPKAPTKSRWWERCPHNPYFHEYDVELTTPVYEERDGKTFKIDTKVEVEHRSEPYWEQVPETIRHYSGRGVADSIERGYVFPEDLGYAPMCDYYNCGEQNPKFRTPVGNYHSRKEAQMMMLVLDGDMQSSEAAAIFVGGGNDEKALQRQMRETGV